MFQILTLNNISEMGLSQFPENEYKLLTESDNPDGIVLRSHKLHEMDFNNNLKIIGRAGAGVNNIPVEKLSEVGIPVLNTPGANANAVKELVLTAMLLISRNIYSGLQFSQNLTGSDQEINKLVESGKKQFVGSELHGKKLGVIGLGAIGVKVANMAESLGMEVIGFDPAMTVRRAWELSSQVEQADSMEHVLRESDFVTVHVPFLESTKNLINQKSLAQIKPNTVLLNFSRAELVEETAVLAALESNQLSAFASDFPSNLLLKNPKVLQLPHLGASTREAEENCAVMVVKQMRDFLEFGNIRNSVNFPEVVLGGGTGFRLAIANANVPNMVGQISTILAESNLNIIDMLNKSKGDIAYTLLDINQKPDESILEKLKNIAGVLNVRLISH